VTVDGYEKWAAHYPEAKDTKQSLVLIGHSFGALAACKIAKMLKKKVPLLVLFDYSPYYSGLVGHPPDGIVPSNVIKAVNFFQKVDPLVRGVEMKREGDSFYQVKNIQTKYVHVEIDKAEHLHDEVIKAIREI